MRGEKMNMISLQIEIFLLMAIGYILAKKGYFDKKTRTQLSNIVLMVILPCSIIKSFQIELTHDILVSTFIILVISFGIQLLYHLFNLFLYQNLEHDKKICCQYGTMVSNAGFLGMPISEGVFGSMGLLYASVFLIPQRIFMWSSGLSLFAKNKQNNVLKQVLTHPCIIAVYIGIILMVLQSIGITLPTPINSTIAVIAQCNTAMSMFVIGGILSDVDGHEILDKDAFIYSFYRLIAIPLIIMLILRILHVDTLSANLCILLSAMPAASTTAMLAQKYDGNAIFASKLVFVSTLFSLITLPLITMLFQTI